MPYTPPSQQSPASSKHSSPTLSRSSSYSDAPMSPTSQRPQLPRSMSSASYLHKHRRSPSITKSDGAPPTPTDVVDFAARTSENTFSNSNGSVRQSPPPVNNLLIPTGAVISPPDSSENSDGDEASGPGRGRDLGRTWNELQEAVRSIDLRRESSPEREGKGLDTSTSQPVSQTISPTALTAEARKISHSRSSTETAIIIPSRTPTFSESPMQTSDDSDEDEGPLSKPSLVRKKSGELVKPALRPSSRRRYSSMPGTPTYSKSVHFNDNGNQTRHFLQVDKPIAVSAGSSPVETYDSETEYPFEGGQSSGWDIKLANFPEDTFERKSKPVRVERMFLSADHKTLIGTVACQNIAFHKLVVARFTLDYWKTTSEVVADFNSDVRQKSMDDGCDRFSFNIKLSDQANIETKTLLLCVRYNVNGQDFWDNNDDMNYQVDFVKNVTAKKHSAPVSGGLGARPVSAIPRSRHSPPTSRGRTPSVDDDFVARFDTGSAYHFGSPREMIGDSPTSIKLKPRSKRGSIFPSSNAQPANGLGGRYDFSASLSAALSTAQGSLGKQSGPVTSNGQTTDSGYFTQDHKDGPNQPTETPVGLTSDRPAMGSDQYKDLVQKFCYFTPGSGKGSPTVIKSQPKAGNTDGAHDDESDSTYNSRSSASTTPSPPQAMSPLLDGSNDRSSTPSSLSPFMSRSGSPSPVTGHSLGDRAASPVSFGYPYRRDGYLSDSLAPTAITY